MINVNSVSSSGGSRSSGPTLVGGMYYSNLFDNEEKQIYDALYVGIAEDLWGWQVGQYVQGPFITALPLQINQLHYATASISSDGRYKVIYTYGSNPYDDATGYNSPIGKSITNAKYKIYSINDNYIEFETDKITVDKYAFIYVGTDPSRPKNSIDTIYSAIFFKNQVFNSSYKWDGVFWPIQTPKSTYTDIGDNYLTSNNYLKTGTKMYYKAENSTASLYTDITSYQGYPYIKHTFNLKIKYEVQRS